MEISSERKTEIYEEYHRKVLSYIRGKVGDSTLAEDLCADVFLKVYEKIDTFDQTKASISTWIYTIAHNTVIDQYRRTRPTEEIPEDMANNDDPLAEVCNDEALDALAVALKKLDERERHLIIERYYNNASLKDIASEMNISYSYVKILHNNALKKMKEFM